MKAVHFGAGNIGRGFIGYLLRKSGYEVTFVDIADSLVDNINKYGEYTVITLSTTQNKEKIEDVKAVSLKDIPSLEKVVLDADLITTSLGANNLKSTGNTLKGILKKRAQTNPKPLDIIACENALMATDMLKDAIFEGENSEFREYLEKSVGFPNSAVDRIVPNVDMKKELPIDVAVEDFYEWDIEKNKVKVNDGIKGAEYVEKLSPFLERKLFLLNGAHATIAYLGYLKKYEFIHEAIKDDFIQKVAIGFHSEAVKALSIKHKMDIDSLTRYSKKIINRFKNAYLKDQVFRVGRDPVRKLSGHDRLITPLNLCYELKLEYGNIICGIAAGFLFDYEGDEKAKQIQQGIKANGIKKTICDITGLAVENPLNAKIAEKYEELKNNL
ncbi:mannitol-1-phosphate 5-dehydrogenase [Clostridium tyrobutyricum]|uniref:mannitol-1-phosphate 5-dehydrogenase n=1 Tax=Clostridium tyrobutyricum TaxID=1519 RepID=UPI0020120C28|nr:mannitol-1-phosphate 5-dehydrogenase [Clostridium tyrobutyricum]MBR9647377.1 mannitol-1-phosphate 5-dehydrogenase [Clostridium tyrobutyricum]